MKCLNYFLTAYLLIFCLMGCKKDDNEPTQPLIEEDQVVYDDVHTFNSSFVAGSDSHVSPNSHFYYFEVTSDSTDINVDIELIKGENSPNVISLDVELAELYENHNFTDIQEAFNIQAGQLLQSNAPKGLYAVKVFGNLPGIEHEYELTVSGNGLVYNGQRETEEKTFNGQWTPWGTGTYFSFGGATPFKLSARDPHFTVEAMPDETFFEIKIATDNGSDFIYLQGQQTSDYIFENYPLDVTASYHYLRPSNTSFNYQEDIQMYFVGQKVNPASNYQITFSSWEDAPISVYQHELIEHKIEDVWVTGGGNDPNSDKNPNYRFEVEIDNPIALNMIISSEIQNLADNTIYDFVLFKGDDPETRTPLINLSSFADYIEYSQLNVNNLIGEIYYSVLFESGTYSIALMGDKNFADQTFEFYFITQGLKYSVSEPEKMW